MLCLFVGGPADGQIREAPGDSGGPIPTYRARETGRLLMPHIDHLYTAHRFASLDRNYWIYFHESLVGTPGFNPMGELIKGYVAVAAVCRNAVC